MLRKMEFPQKTYHSLELEKVSFTEHMAMIRVNQVRLVSISK